MQAATPHAPLLRLPSWHGVELAGQHFDLCAVIYSSAIKLVRRCEPENRSVCHEVRIARSKVARRVLNARQIVARIGTMQFTRLI